MNPAVRALMAGIIVFALGFGLAGSRALPQQRTAGTRWEREDPDIERMRREWFYGQRAYPLSRIPTGVRSRAIKDLRRMMDEAEKKYGRAITAGPSTAAGAGLLSTTQWTLLGPMPTSSPYQQPTGIWSGRVTALAVDPRNSNVVYAGGAQGGVWKTLDGGQTWTPLTDFQPSLSIGSLAIDPSNPDTVYAGTGCDQGGYYGAGILKSTDAGNTWTNLPGPFEGPFGPDTFFGGGAEIDALSVHPTNSSILLAAVWRWPHSAAGIFRSTDAGNTWTQVFGGAAGGHIVFDPTDGNIAYAALGDYYTSPLDGVYKSTDGGQTWALQSGTGANSMPTGSSIQSTTLAISPTNPLTLYASVNAGSGPVGFYKTTDGGQNWIRVADLPLSPYGTGVPEWAAAMCVHPNNPNVILAGNVFLYRSLDGGNSWSTVQESNHADMHSFAYSADGSRVYLGDDGGVSTTTGVTNAGALTWTSLNQNLSITEFYPGIGTAPSDFRKLLIAGSQDNGTQIYHTNMNWDQVNCGDGGWTVVDPVTPNVVYVTCNGIFLAKSTSSGQLNTYVSAQSGINTADPVAFIPPFVQDPSKTQNLYFGTNRVYQTTNGAGSWSSISPVLNGVLSTIAVAPTNSNIVYAGTSDSQVQVTSNAGGGSGATWTNVSSGLPPRYVEQIAVSPTDAATAYATFSGFTGFVDALGHVFKTTNQGQSWADISSNLPNIPVNAIAIDPDVVGILYIGTDVGMFYTKNDGQSWSPLGAGLPNVVVTGLNLHEATRTILAGTYGRSMWALSLQNIAAPTVTVTPH